MWSEYGAKAGIGHRPARAIVTHPSWVISTIAGTTTSQVARGNS